MIWLCLNEFEQLEGCRPISIPLRIFGQFWRVKLGTGCLWMMPSSRSSSSKSGTPFPRRWSMTWCCHLCHGSRSAWRNTGKRFRRQDARASTPWTAGCKVRATREMRGFFCVWIEAEKKQEKIKKNPQIYMEWKKTTLFKKKLCSQVVLTNK